MNTQFNTKRGLKRIAVAVTVTVSMVYSWLSKAIQPIESLGPIQRTIVVYSGPTSLDGSKGKNFMYLKNLDYYIRHGISCTSTNVDIDYVIVLTQDVAKYYSSPGGLIDQKIQMCVEEVATAKKSNTNDNDSLHIHKSSIEIVVRQDRCYDMESIRMVVEQKDLSEYDNMVFLNCGMVGPKIGPNSPFQLGTRHWTQVFTSLLTESVHMSGLSINPCRKKICPIPHVQSFLYAISIETLQTFFSDGIIYDCAGDIDGVVYRYEIGMSRKVLNEGFRIAVPYLNNLDLGKALYLDRGNIGDMELVKSRGTGDVWKPDRLRMATSTMNKTDLNRLVPAIYGEDHDNSRDILPWEFYMFFKVSRFVPHDIQLEMEYDLDLLRLNLIKLAPNKCC